MPLTKNHFFRSSDQKLINSLHKIRIFRNGDNAYKGHVFKFRKSSFRDFPTLLVALTKEMQDSIFLHIGGVRGLYTIDGIEVTSIDDLLDGEAYVATCLSEPFKPIMYPIQSRTTLSQASTTLIKTRSLSSLRRGPASACSSTSLEYRGPSGQLFRPRYITIIQADGEKPRKIFRIHLTNSNATHLQMVLDRINHQATFDRGKPLDRVYKECCAEVKCLEDFFGNNFVFFAFPKCSLTWDMFDISNQEDAVIGELNEVPVQSDAWMHFLPVAVKAQYRLKGMVSGSGFTVVHECLERSTHRRFALKIARRVKNNLFAESFIKPMLNEMSILPDLHHPNIISIFLTEDTPDTIYSVTEFFEGGDLRMAIINDSVKREEYLPFMDNLASALAYLHLRGIAHRDVCPTNMMLRREKGQRKLVLTDFNQATRVEEPLYDSGGFLLYMAPEMVARKGYGLKADIWSAGVTLYLMVTKSLPFEGRDVDKCTRQILRQPVEYDDDDWDRVDDAVKVLTDLMLCRDTVQRLSAGEVLAFIANVRDGHYHQYEFDHYCGVEMEAKRRRKRRRSSSRCDEGRRDCRMY